MANQSWSFPLNQQSPNFNRIFTPVGLGTVTCQPRCSLRLKSRGLGPVVLEGSATLKLPEDDSTVSLVWSTTHLKSLLETSNDFNIPAFPRCFSFSNVDQIAQIASALLLAAICVHLFS
jgi:hypothetical protein